MPVQFSKENLPPPTPPRKKKDSLVQYKSRNKKQSMHFFKIQEFEFSFLISFHRIYGGLNYPTLLYPYHRGNFTAG